LSYSELGTFRNFNRLFLEIDWWLVSATVFLLFVSLLTLVYSGRGASVYYERQLDFVWTGIAAAVVFWWTPYQFWVKRNNVYALYAINLILLLTVMVVGHSAQGAQRWLAIGPVTLQPSEIAKLIIVFTLAAWLTYKPIRGFLDILKAGAIILPPALLVFKQPDLGTSLTFGAVFLGMCFWAGATVGDILALLSPLISLITNALGLKIWLAYAVINAIVLAFIWRNKIWTPRTRIIMVGMIYMVTLAAGVVRPHLWGMLKEYQQKRLTSFVNPYEDPRGSGYHILQSLIAIGSGGFNGVGLGKGNQSQGAFIPERHTDFIFSVVGEELGFKVAGALIIAYGIICYRALSTAWQSRQDFTGSLIAIGIMSMFLFHAFLNVGMTMGIMPVAGVPLPFLSYGGTALIINMMAIGVLQSIRGLNPRPRNTVWK
jgi:rod shape determining protein RodA